MATYGSTLDSLMANRLGEDALAAREQASYRDYLNAMANTNIRKREQESMDRYRQGELGIRGEDVSGLNQFRTGQIGIGRTDAATRAAAAGSQAAYQQSLVDAARIAEQNRLNLETERNRLFGEQIKAGQQIPPLQKALVDQFGVAGAVQQAPALFGAQPSENMQLLKFQKQAEEESLYQNALNSATQQALDEYDLQTGGWGLRFNSDRTDAIKKIMNDQGVSAALAARIYTENRMAPTYGRRSRFAAALSSATQPLQSGSELTSGSNRIPGSVISPLLSSGQTNSPATNRPALGSFMGR